MELFIICRKNGRVEISKEYKNKTRQEAKQLIMFFIANYDGYICTCPTRQEAIEIVEKLNGK